MQWVYPSKSELLWKLELSHNLFVISSAQGPDLFPAMTSFSMTHQCMDHHQSVIAMYIKTLGTVTVIVRMNFDSWWVREPASPLSHSFSFPSIGRLLTSFERSPIWKYTIRQGAFGEFGRCWWEISCSFLHLWRGQEQSANDWSGLPPKCTKPTKSNATTI